MDVINIREGRKEDCEVIAGFLRELGDYVGGAAFKTADAQKLKDDGFGEDSWFNTLIAEIVDKSGCKEIVGVLLYYKSYSMFRDRSMHMEAIFVNSAHRNKGIGLRLIKEVAKKAISDGCTNLSLTANALNTNAIRMYERNGLIDHYKAMNVNLVLLRADQATLEQLAASDEDKGH